MRWWSNRPIADPTTSADTERKNRLVEWTPRPAPPRPRNRISPGSRRIRVSGAILRRKLDGIQFFSAHTYHMNFRSRPNSTKRDHCGPGRPIHSTVPTPVDHSTHGKTLQRAVCMPAPCQADSQQLRAALRSTARQGGARRGSVRRTRPSRRWRWALPSRRSGACRQGHGSGEYVHMQAHGQGKRARIGTPWNEELVGSKIPAGGGRAERAEEPTLLIGPSIRAREA